MKKADIYSPAHLHRLHYDFPLGQSRRLSRSHRSTHSVVDERGDTT